MIWMSAAVHHSQVFCVVKTPLRYRLTPPVQRDSAAGGATVVDVAVAGPVEAAIGAAAPSEAASVKTSDSASAPDARRFGW